MPKQCPLQSEHRRRLRTDASYTRFTRTPPPVHTRCRDNEEVPRAPPPQISRAKLFGSGEERFVTVLSCFRGGVRATKWDRRWPLNDHAARRGRGEVWGRARWPRGAAGAITTLSTRRGRKKDRSWKGPGKDRGAASPVFPPDSVQQSGDSACGALQASSAAASWEPRGPRGRLGAASCPERTWIIPGRIRFLRHFVLFPFLCGRSPLRFQCRGLACTTPH